MIRKYIAVTLTVLGLLGALSGCQSGSDNTAAKDIGKDEASNIAFDDAKTSESEVTRFRVSQDQDDGQKIYEIQFTADGADYDYEILASSGEILSVEKDIPPAQTAATAAPTQAAVPTQSASPTAVPEQTPQASQNTQLSIDEAKQLVLSRIEGATDRDIQIELEHDDGYYKYEGEVHYNHIEYEFEINADTGEFLEWSEDR